MIIISECNYISLINFISSSKYIKRKWDYQKQPLLDFIDYHNF